MTIKLTVICVICCFAYIFPGKAHAASFYVDNTCNVNGNGMSQACAASTGGSGSFNSLPAAQTAVTGDHRGDTLYLKKSQIYSGQFTINAYGAIGLPFTISSYGSGNQPVITGGTNNIGIQCSGCGYIHIDGLELKNAVNYGISLYAPANNITIRNSYVHHARSGIYIWDAHNITIDGNEIVYNSSEGINPRTSNGHTILNLTISNNKIAHNKRYGILTNGNPNYRQNGTGSKIFGNEVFNNSTGIYLVFSDNLEIFNNNIHDNGKDCQGTADCTGEPYGLAIQSGSYNAVHDNYITRSADTGIGVYGSQQNSNENSDSNKIHRNIITGTFPNKWSVQRDINWQVYPGNSGGFNNQIVSNIVIGNGWNMDIGDSNPAVDGNAAYNNLLFGGKVGLFFENNSSNAGWTVKNNIFAYNTDYAVDASKHSGGLKLDNNLYYKPNGGTVVRYGSNSYTSPTLIHLDPYAKTADPKFTDTNNWHGFRLLPDSPAIDAGLNLGINFNLAFSPDDNSWPVNTADQNEYGLGWEIGPFVYTGSIPTPTPVPKPGDANGDNLVDEADYMIWKTHYGQAVSGVVNGDFNGDGKTDGVDFVVWMDTYGR